MLKLDELRIFVTTAEANSFVGAANQLGIAPSVVSKSIRNLEDRLNTTLFNRTTRKIRITSDGEWLLGQAAQTMRNLDAIHMRFVDDRTEPEGRLTVDAATPFALHAIAPVISQFIERYPRIEISIESNESITDLIEKKVDVAIRIGDLKDSTLKARKMGLTRRALYASPEYIRRHGEPRGVHELDQHRCLGFTSPKSLNLWPLVTESGDRVSILPHLRANSGETLKQLALFHNGIVCLSEFTVQRELSRGELVPILADQIEPNAMPIYAVYYSERAAARHLRLFLDFLKEKLSFSVSHPTIATTG